MAIYLGFTEDQRLMSEGDSAAWIPLGGLAIGLVSGLAGFVWRSWAFASNSGESVGELRVWRATVDERFKNILMLIAEQEARTGLRLVALDARKDIIDARLANVPSRDEMQAGLSRIESKLDRVAEYLHRDLREGERR